MSKSIGKIVKMVAPVAAAFIPGIGPLASAAIGAGAGALGGGGLKGALLGGLTSGAGNLLGSSGVLGQAAGATLDKVSGVAGAAGPTAGSGIMGTISKAGSGLAKALTGGGATSSGGLANVLGTANSYMAQRDAEKELLKAQGRAESAISPYSASGLAASNQLNERLSAGFNPGDLESDAGYQFQLSQGQKALERSLAAKGLGQSGAALKAAQDYGQGMAKTKYNDAYAQWLQQNSQLAGQAGTGYNAAQNIAGIYDTTGDIKANAGAAKSNILSGALYRGLSGSGAGDILYIDANGNPVYKNRIYAGA